MIVICELCSKEYKTFKNWYNRTKHHTCSRECADNLKKKLSIKQCQCCQKDYYKSSGQKRSKYCSQSCQSEASKKRINLNCEICKKEYSVNFARKNTSRFCSKDCLRKHTGYLASTRIGILNSQYKGFNDEKRTNKSKLKLWSNLVKRRDKSCKLCGSIENLEAHHVKSYKDNPDLRFDIDNGITLCLKCHALQHIDDPKSLRLITYKIAKARKK